MKLISPSRTLSAAAVLIVALAVAGCGSSKKDSSTQSAAPASTTTQSTPAPSAGGGAALKVAADPSGQLKFDKSALTAKAGKVTLTESNSSSVPHGIGVSGNGVDKDGPTGGQGSTSSVTVDLKPGKYEFYCPVPGHKEGGMKGTLTVQ